VIFNRELLAEFKSNLERHFSGSGNSAYNPENVYIKEYRVEAPTAKLSREQWIYENVDPTKVELSVIYWLDSKKPPYEVINTSEFNSQFHFYRENAIDLMSKVSLMKILSKVLVNDIFPIELLDHATPSTSLGRGFSTHALPGAIFIKAPVLEFGIVENHALNLVHEMAHQALMLVQWHNPIFNSGSGDPIYSVIRKVNRPAIKCLHALVATSFMLKYLRNLKAQNIGTGVLSETYKSLLSCQHQGVDLMRGLDYTEVGEEIFNDCFEVYEENV